MTRQYWLMKSELSAYSIDDLARDRRTFWDGVRNYEARNNMRAMRVGDEAFFYHSNCDPPHIAGIVRIVRKAYPDYTAFDQNDSHYDPRSTRENPVWDMVDVELKKVFTTPVSITDLRHVPSLRKMALFTRSRLSVQPVTRDEWDTISLIIKTAGKKSGSSSTQRKRKQ